ncbi:hypothetical protein SAMN04488498_1215 [Mesorhizobium albiziae]|uniref:YdhG-like domain-containing protein n=1 Tax=Neomesorhizobium albiziae TaxID=335020 RepID=A0A1I4E1T2_9HYPH|nr:DUF1801 domain-containing protein [Mesorhizobium albiziae]GLS31172.1 hypothetical protein GCM10007937_28820 [Mesorhizobium albiziae]SFK98527.1 hypothetical protein SAMN04488498_1215 [Mesorhizobium albiziae]
MSKKVDDYIAGLSGWQAAVAAMLRREILATGAVSEDFKWGHPIYEAGGAVALFKAHKAHVTLGFWRGAEMTDLDARLEPSGSFKMASITLKGPGEIDGADIGKLVAAGVALNRERGDPMKIKKT